eukprot:symbB.v1.2.040334.t1/scaffold7150.1/size14085/1
MAGRILIMFDGTRGDLQPVVVAARALIESGFDVMLSGPGDGNTMAKEFNVPFTRSRISAQKVMVDAKINEAAHQNDIIKVISAFQEAKNNLQDPQKIEEEMTALYHLIENWKPDLIIGCTVAWYLALLFAKLFRIPAITMSLQLDRPCRSIPMMGMEKLPRFIMPFMWWFVMRMAFKDTCKEVLPTLSKLSGIPKSRLRVGTSEAYRFYSAQCKFLSIIGVSPAVVGDTPDEFSCNNVVVGALMPSEDQQGVASFGSEEQHEVERFLAAGDAPIYMGFGSIVSGSSKFMTLQLLRALKITGERGILMKGWSSMCIEDVEGEEDAEELKAYAAEKVLFIAKASHTWLFPRCKVLVHHGGAGTFNASTRSGTPTVIAPIFVDQPYHASLLNKRGNGVGTATLAKLKPKDLAEAISKCINTPSIQQKAKEVAQQMSQEDGRARFVEVIKDYFESHIKTGKHQKMVDFYNQQSCWPCCGSNPDSY